MTEDWTRPVVHWEIHAREPERMRAFYSAMFNWNISDGLQIPAGIGAPEPISGHIQSSTESRIALMIQVRDITASCEKAVTLGGKLIRPPNIVEGKVTFAWIEDPEGNRVHLVQQ
jgi:predicted enzyme related to lactoylglutathione lyase